MVQLVHFVTGRVVPIGHDYPIDELRYTTAIFDGGNWQTVGEEQMAVRWVMDHMSGNPVQDADDEQWLSDAAGLANRIVDRLSESIGNRQTLDLWLVRESLNIRSATPTEQYAWTAALATIAESPLATNVRHVTDIGMDQSGNWHGVELPKLARQRYVVLGDANWYNTSGTVIRRARMVPLAESQPSRVSRANQPVTMRVEFASRHKTIEQPRPTPVAMQSGGISSRYSSSPSGWHPAWSKTPKIANGRIPSPFSVTAAIATTGLRPAVSAVCLSRNNFVRLCWPSWKG
ncbi:hypothetical protein [Kibdelosporangium philippinense]|uniref:hypothetical protein n=1 Tax=Kibdelosporangium philippinense TaxID=211113 RepID=UPI003617BB09